MSFSDQIILRYVFYQSALLSILSLITLKGRKKENVNNSATNWFVKALHCLMRTSLWKHLLTEAFFRYGDCAIQLLL